jgi:magnesium-protoporphyrin O-methyltransferase
MDSCGCDPHFAIFDRRTAQHDRERFRRGGPDRSTRMLLEMLGPIAGSGSTLLDVGGGIGVIDHALLRAGAGHAVLVDASPAYVAVARDLAREDGLFDRLELVEGDFVRLAPAIEPADIVTLDRVVCCYPDAEGLVGLSAMRARRAYGLVLPRDGRLIQIGVRLVNAWYRIRGEAYRTYVHPNANIDAITAAAGLRPLQERTTWFWRIVVYERSSDSRLRDPSGR